MISPELLRYFPFFGVLSHEQLNKIAVITEEVNIPAGTNLFEECQLADYLYLLISGNVDLSYKSVDDFHPETAKVFHVGEINPGEVFGVSALLEPYEYNATAHISKNSRVLKIDASSLRAQLKADPELGYIFMYEIAKAIVERLFYTRVQLAAARS